jgi:hypothetical protein
MINDLYSIAWKENKFLRDEAGIIYRAFFKFTAVHSWTYSSSDFAKKIFPGQKIRKVVLCERSSCIILTAKRDIDGIARELT